MLTSWLMAPAPFGSGMLSDDHPVVSAVVVVVPGDPRGGLDDGPRRLQRPRLPIHDLGGGRAELLHLPRMKVQVGSLGIPGVDGAWRRRLLRRAICVGSGVARFHRLPLLPALHRVDDDPGPDAYDHDASDHLTGDQRPSPIGHGRNITESDG